MSFDLTLWHDPRLRRFDKAMARLDAARPLNAAARRRLAELTDALLALPGVRWSVDPAVDEAHLGHERLLIDEPVEGER